MFTVLTFYHVPGLSFFRLLPVPVSTYRTGYDVGIACVIIRWRILETPACIGDPASIRGFTVYNYQGAWIDVWGRSSALTCFLLM